MIARNGEDAVVFALPGQSTGVFSLGFLQHAGLSDFAWHPSRAIGNSLSDPRVPLSGTLPAPAEDGGWAAKHIGGSTDTMRSATPDSWKAAADDLLQGIPDAGGQPLFDLSFEVNQTLWDRYFIGGDADGRLLRMDKTEESSTDFHDAASRLTVDGAFNVNSLSVAAWTAVLAGTRQLGMTGAKTIFRRIPETPDEESRGLTDEEIKRLADAIVTEVRRRGPFLGLADFVNRRLVNGETGKRGALEAAIHTAGLNSTINETYPLRDDPKAECPPEIREPLIPATDLKPSSTAWGQRNHLTQADILQTMGNTFSSRSDTFLIRAYGLALAADGDPSTRAWCEAVVQRQPSQISKNKAEGRSMSAGGNIDFGRRFQIISFRWLSPGEI